MSQQPQPSAANSLPGCMLLPLALRPAGFLAFSPTVGICAIHLQLFGSAGGSFVALTAILITLGSPADSLLRSECLAGIRLVGLGIAGREEHRHAVVGTVTTVMQ